MSLLHSHTYAAMVAGSVAVKPGQAGEAVASIATSALHDARLHALVASDEQRAYYFAVPSATVSHGAGFATQLAAALPGHPGHQGDGMYALVLGRSAIAAVRRGIELFIVRVDVDALAAKAQALELPLHRLGLDTEAWPLESLFGKHRQLVERHSAKWAKIFGITLAACTVAYASLMGAETYAARHGGRLWQTTPAADTVKHLQYTSPLFEQLAHFQRISATVVRSGGWINGYIWKPNKGEAFEIVMPGWISQDYVEALGKDAIAEYNIPDNLVVVRKGDLEKLSKP
jgi:hypothetical protein